MTKRDLLDYLDKLINNLKEQREGVLDKWVGDIVDLEKQFDSVLRDTKNLAKINFEKVDEYINIPDDALNVLTLYQLLCQSTNFPLEQSQKIYINYMFSALKRIIYRAKDEKLVLNKDIDKYSYDIVCLNDIKNILVSKVKTSLDDYEMIIRIIISMNYEQKSIILENLSNYMQYALVNNNKNVENYQKNR